MMLDDFFTLTEMNHGLTSPSRVTELVAVMQKGRNGTVHVGDTIRQWSAVASAIAATDNKDCLDLFIQLDGVQFIDKWLKDVQKFNSDSDKSFPEETIIHLLQALETLHMNYEKLVASEIWVTVEDLLVHGSSKVQGKARVLFESWKCKRDGVDSVSVEKVGALADDEMDESEHVQRGSECSKSPSIYPSPSCDFSGLEKGQDSTTDEQVPPTVSEAFNPGSAVGACNSNKILDTPNEDDRASDQVVPPLSKSSVGFSTCESVGTTLVESSITAVPRQDMHDGLAEFPMLESAGDLMHAHKIECSSEKLISLKESKKSENQAMSSSSDAAGANNSVMEHENKNSCDEGPPFIDSKKIDSGGKDTDEGSHENKCRSSSLDLSRQVSIEEEREAADSKEQSCSSEKLPESNIRRPDNLDPVNENQSHDSEGSHNKVMNIPELTAEASPVQKFATCIENPGMAQTSSPQDMETSQVTEVPHEEAREEKGPSKFDLNQEVRSEDIDRPENQTGATSILSASGEVPVPGLPVSPMQFEGNLGWKGSADKSDFLPASPGQRTKSNEDLTVGVISSTPKPPRGFHEIDLNVTESGDGNTRDLLHYKQVPVNSGIPSGESSVETDSRKSERHDLNLNLTSEDDRVPSDWKRRHIPGENDHRHQSHSSSASSKRPLSIIDLNDQPNFPNDSYDISCLSDVHVSGGTKTDGSIISIMGARVKVNPKDLVPQTIPFPNGRTPELTFDVNVSGTESCFAIGSVLPYAHSPVFGYNNVTPVPAVAALPFSSSSYGYGGAIPYTLHSSIPQITGNGFSQRPFILNMMSSIPADGGGPSGSSFDLNSGAMIKDGSRDPLVLRDFLNLGPVNSMDDQLRSDTLPTVGSDNSGKRKEPDNGLECYPFRNCTPPWK